MKKRLLHHILGCCTISILVTSCNMSGLNLSPDTVEDTPVSTAPDTKNTTIAPAVNNEVLVEKSSTMFDKRQRIVEIGDGKFTGTSKNNNAISKDAEEGDVTLNFQGTDINEFIKVILGDVLSLNFVIDPQVSGSVTIETSIPVKQENLFSLLEQILSINNAAIIESNGFYQILPKSKVVKGNLSPVTPDVQVSSGL